MKARAAGQPAYDGSTRRARRALSPLERDIVCRVLTDVLSCIHRNQDLNALRFEDGGGIRMSRHEVAILAEIRAAIDPREDR